MFYLVKDSFGLMLEMAGMWADALQVCAARPDLAGAEPDLASAAPLIRVGLAPLRGCNRHGS